MPEIKRRNDELAKKHELSKLDLDKINEHAKIYEAKQKEQEETRKEAHEQWKATIREREANAAQHYKSKAIERDAAEAALQSPSYYEKSEEQQRLDKRLRYATLAKELHKPQIDTNKRLEIANIKLPRSNTKPKLISKSQSA